MVAKPLLPILAILGVLGALYLAYAVCKAVLELWGDYRGITTGAYAVMAMGHLFILLFVGGVIPTEHYRES